MSSIPRNRIPAVAIWLAANGHNLLTAPSGLVQLALEDTRVPYSEPEFGDPRPELPPDDEHDSWWV